MHIVATVAIGLAVLPAAFLAAQVGAEFLAVDRCLDAGGVYDYRQGVCRGDVEHLPTAPFLERHGRLIASVVGMSLTGAGLLVVARLRR